LKRRNLKIKKRTFNKSNPRRRILIKALRRKIAMRRRLFGMLTEHDTPQDDTIVSPAV
jgi:hypothetical protein